MEIELRIMRYVITIAEEAGFQKAAERLHMAQPPLSRQIRALEHRLGTPLFERRPVRLTEAGAVFVDAARDILARTDRLVEQTIVAGRGELGTVRVGYILSAAYDTLPRLIDAVKQRHPAIHIDAQEGWSPDLDTALAEGGFDLVLSHTVPDRPAYARQPLRHEGFTALVDAHHDFAGGAAVALREFAGQTFRFYSSHLAPAHHAALMTALRVTGETFNYEEDPVPGLRRLDLRDRASFTLVPVSMARHLVTAEVAAVPLVEPPTLDLELVWRRDDLPPAAALVVSVADTLTHTERWTD
ncbi:LysR family transcriptional regulator [Amycolatopsis samaneae]|uniref:LysR family transcriptional regulator n=1 Tax=Amycolatopsis samaneae TaxID=664691 RepID=A0ABW5GKD9_9PSEU